MSPRKRSKASAEAIGSVIRAWRHRRNLAQKQLAAKAGVTPGTIGTFERGERTPSLELRAKICAGLELDPLIFCREVAAVEGREMRKLLGDNADPKELTVDELSASWDVLATSLKPWFLKLAVGLAGGESTSPPEREQAMRESQGSPT